MLAGIFAQHGFFFGKCRPADDRNPKGFYENLEIYKGREEPLDILKRQGLERYQNWGVKVGDGIYGRVKRTPFDLTLMTWRDPEEIAASRGRAEGFSVNRRNMCRKALQGPHKVINTSKLARGDLAEIREAFALLGLPFSEETTRAWIDPEIWNRGLET